MHRPKHFFCEIVTHRWRGHFLQTFKYLKNSKSHQYWDHQLWDAKTFQALTLDGVINLGKENGTKWNLHEPCDWNLSALVQNIFDYIKIISKRQAIFSKLYLFKTLLTDLRKTPDEIIWRKTFQTPRLDGASPHTTPSPIDRVWSLIQMEKVNK